MDPKLVCPQHVHGCVFLGVLCVSRGAPERRFQRGCLCVCVCARVRVTKSKEQQGGRPLGPD